MIDFEPKWHASDDQLVLGLLFLEQLGVLQVCRHVDGGFEGVGEKVGEMLKMRSQGSCGSMLPLRDYLVGAQHKHFHRR